jgi:hypothetical protein
LFQHFFSGIYFRNQRVNRSHLLHGMRIASILIVPLCLLGCAGAKQTLIYETFKKGFENPNSVIDQTALNPSYRYLKVDVNNLAALLVLGYEDSTPNGVVSTWYSAYKEVVQIQNGRLVSTQGLELNWTDVSFKEAPSLSKIALTDQAVGGPKKSALRFQRTRTVMPSYRANIEETVEIKPLEMTPTDAPVIFQQSNAASIRWVEETVVMQTSVRTPYLDPVRAIYAIDTKTAQVIYGRQCLAAQFCISWLQWPIPTILNQHPPAVPSK